MRSLTFDDVFAMLSAVALSASDLVRLREWSARIALPDECIALIEQAARGRPCPHCRHQRSHRCGQASGLQRFRCLGCRRTYNALTGTPLARLRKKAGWNRARFALRRASSACIARPASDGATGSCPVPCVTGRPG